MKKEERQIATNLSSGAEKVEKITKETRRVDGKTAAKKTMQTKKQTTAKGEAALGAPKEAAKEVNAKKLNSAHSGAAAEKESQRAKQRVEAALKKKEEKEKKKAAAKAARAKRKEARKKRLAEWKAQIAKRNAERKARAEKRAAERKALAEKRAAEKEAKLRAKKENAKKSAKKRQSKKESQGERKNNRNQGYGGWLAAVVTLGVVSLALGATATVERMETQSAMQATMSSYRATMYELTGIMENVDNDLDRVRVSDSSVQQERILTDLLVQTRMAELDLEKMPLTAEADRNVTSFINRTAMECERMLSILRNGGELSQADRARLNELYQINHAIRQEINGMMSKMTDKDLKAFIKEGKGSIADAISKVEKLTLEENKARLGGDMDGAGTKRNTPNREEESASKIDPAEAEELCKGYFKTYDIGDFQCVGETIGRFYTAYNVQGYDGKGSMLFAEVSKTDGALLRFDYYEECKGDTFDIANAEKIAEEFLQSLGYADMEAVRLRHNGTTTDFTFVYEADGVAYYPDAVRVKVCRTRGVVSGLDATQYVHNHKAREGVKTEISLAEAYDKLYDGLEVEASRLAVVRTMRGERPAYEFYCSYGEENYLIYLDALSGEEISIVNTKNL
ncbi:MAG: germination protein YpeB [Clostridia bacterium]|nr:germination protein YpeB [Clostridia bacterium]